MMEWIKPNTNIDFIGNRRKLIAVSLALCVGSIVIVAAKGLNFGIDFAGGYEFQVEFPKPVKAEQVSDILTKAGIDGVIVQSYGDAGDKEYLLRIERHGGVDVKRVEAAKEKLKGADAANVKEFIYNAESADRIRLSLTKDLGAEAVKSAFADAGLAVKSVERSPREDRAEYQVALVSIADKVEQSLKTALALPPDTKVASRVEFVGPQVGKQLRNQGLLAVIYSFAFILIYIAFRFDFYFGPGAIVCLFHDTLLTVGVWALLGKEFNLQTIAALLTIVGYSVNDTIVIFDRVRENNVRLRGRDIESLVNVSLNETLSRTILTTFVTMLVVVAMMFFGGGVLSDFALALFLGFFFGTYSSIAIAAPIYIYLRKKFDTSLHAGATQPGQLKTAKS